MLATEQVEIHFYSDEENPTDADAPLNLLLKTGDNLSTQNIYKALCKFFLSVVESKYLPHFSKTIAWINGELEIEKLPKVAEMISYHSFNKQPKLVTYIRKDNDQNVPFAIGRFYFTCVVIVFIIPLTSEDTKDFVDQQDYESFWKSFLHLNRTKGWSFKDFSNAENRQFQIHLNIEKPDNHESTTIAKNP